MATPPRERRFEIPCHDQGRPSSRSAPASANTSWVRRSSTLPGSTRSATANTDAADPVAEPHRRRALSLRRARSQACAQRARERQRDPRPAALEQLARGGAGGGPCPGCLGIPPQPGYPFALAVEVSYALSDDGLTVCISARTTPARRPARTAPDSTPTCHPGARRSRTARCSWRPRRDCCWMSTARCRWGASRSRAAPMTSAHRARCATSCSTRPSPTCWRVPDGCWRAAGPARRDRSVELWADAGAIRSVGFFPADTLSPATPSRRGRGASR